MLVSFLPLRGEELFSPDGRIRLTFNLHNGDTPVYTLEFDGRPVILPSRLGFNLDNSGLHDWFECTGVQRNTIDETWRPVWGEEAEIRNHCNEMVVNLRQTSSDRKMNIRFRVFNDGLGFRYEFPQQNNLRYFVITDELTEFAMSGDHTAWWIP